MKDKYNGEDDDPPLPRSPDVDIKSIKRGRISSIVIYQLGFTYDRHRTNILESMSTPNRQPTVMWFHACVLFKEVAGCKVVPCSIPMSTISPGMLMSRCNIKMLRCGHSAHNLTNFLTYPMDIYWGVG
jgi:hypothetical protein